MNIAINRHQCDSNLFSIHDHDQTTLKWASLTDLVIGGECKNMTVSILKYRN
jgi:hypothetical protein